MLGGRFDYIAIFPLPIIHNKFPPYIASFIAFLKFSEHFCLQLHTIITYLMF
jgi:hypothetical protein